MTGAAVGTREGALDGSCVGMADGLVGAREGAADGALDFVGDCVGETVGDTVGGRVSPSTSLFNDKSLPVVVASAKAATYSASANKLPMVHPADMYTARAPETIGAAMLVPDFDTMAVSLSTPGPKICMPGAQMSTQAP